VAQGQRVQPVQISIPSPHQARAAAGDGGTAVIIPAVQNVNGILLWSMQMTSIVAATVAPVGVETGGDFIQGTGGQVFLTLENGLGAAGQSANSTSQDLWGFPLAATFGLNLVAATITTAHLVSCNVVYSLL